MTEKPNFPTNVRELVPYGIKKHLSSSETRWPVNTETDGQTKRSYEALFSVAMNIWNVWWRHMFSAVKQIFCWSHDMWKVNSWTMMHTSLFLSALFNDALSSWVCMSSNTRWIMNELERIRNEVTWALMDQGKVRENLSHGRCAGRISNPVPSECKSIALLLEPHRSLATICIYRDTVYGLYTTRQYFKWHKVS
jgi:hypothetical protein